MGEIDEGRLKTAPQFFLKNISQIAFFKYAFLFALYLLVSVINNHGCAKLITQESKTKYGAPTARNIGRCNRAPSSTNDITGIGC